MLNMNKRLLVLLVLAVALLAASLPAQATPSDYVEGDWFYHPRLNEMEVVRVAGGNTFIKAIEDGRWSGAFQGSEACMGSDDHNCAASVDHGTGIIHRSGRMTFLAWADFDSVTVNGITGSLEMRVTGSRPDPVTGWEGNWVITGGELHEMGLRGQGPWWGPGWQEEVGVWGVIHYSGNMHFEPN